MDNSLKGWFKIIAVFICMLFLGQFSILTKPEVSNQIVYAFIFGSIIVAGAASFVWVALDHRMDKLNDKLDEMSAKVEGRVLIKGEYVSLEEVARRTKQTEE